MLKETIRFIASAITMFIIYALLNSLSAKDNTSKDPGQDDIHYIVRMPEALKRVYGFVFGFGMFLFFVFLGFKVTIGASVTNAHLIFALVFAGIGLLVVAIASNWHICVHGEHVTVYRLFHKTQRFLFSDIEKVAVGKKDQLSLYKDGKKVVTVDGLSENYDRFADTLHRFGKL